MNSIRGLSISSTRLAAGRFFDADLINVPISRTSSALAVTASDACADAAFLLRLSSWSSDNTHTTTSNQSSTSNSGSENGSIVDEEARGCGELVCDQSRPAPVVQQLTNSLRQAEALPDICYPAATVSRQARRLAAALAAAAAVTDADLLIMAAPAAMHEPADVSIHGDTWNEQQQDEPRSRRRGLKLDGAGITGTLSMEDSLQQLRGLRASTPDNVRSVGG